MVMRRGDPPARRQTWVTWSAIGVLAILCGAVAILQYRWIGEISETEQQRLRDDLRERLNELRRHFNETISSAASDLEPSPDQIRTLGVRAAYEVKYQAANAASKAVFGRIALAEPRGDAVDFLLLDPQNGTFAPALLPQEWSAMKIRLEDRAQGRRPEPPGPRTDALIELPRFRPPGDGAPAGASLILELNLDYVRTTLLPGELRRYLAARGLIEYQAEVVVRADSAQIIYKSGADVSAEEADGEVSLLDDGPGPRGGLGPREPGGPPPWSPGKNRDKKKPKPGFFGGPPPPDGGPGGPGGPGRWLLRVRHQAGSLEALVEQTRRRNLGISAGLLVLILATSGVLVRYTRKMGELAEQQMNFVAGVSHELRTPLTVIRTAAFNLRSEKIYRPEQVERYGTLIEDQSEKLSALVEQVLQFGSASSGVRHSAPVVVQALIMEALDACRPNERVPGIAVDLEIAPDLPPMLADRVALRHAVQNLIENVLKYAMDREPWLGISAALVVEAPARWVEIRVADRGPGIPRDERRRIFEPFFRGQRAIEDQIHGTGLGLNLVQKIAEAQGGSIRLESAAAEGATFVLRIPAAAEGMIHELTNSAG
jgi:signal transduction histidine kinase